MPLDWLDLELRSVDMELHDEIPWGLGRPASPRLVGLGFALFWLNFFVYVAPEFKYSPELVELVNVSENCMITVLKV